MDGASAALTTCLDLWEDYERSHAGLLKWLNETDRQLKQPLGLQASLADKRRQLDKVKVR